MFADRFGYTRDRGGTNTGGERLAPVLSVRTPIPSVRSPPVPCIPEPIREHSPNLSVLSDEGKRFTAPVLSQRGGAADCPWPQRARAQSSGGAPIVGATLRGALWVAALGDVGVGGTVGGVDGRCGGRCGWAVRRVVWVGGATGSAGEHYGWAGGSGGICWRRALQPHAHMHSTTLHTAPAPAPFSQACMHKLQCIAGLHLHMHHIRKHTNIHCSALQGCTCTCTTFTNTDAHTSVH